MALMETSDSKSAPEPASTSPRARFPIARLQPFLGVAAALAWVQHPQPVAAETAFQAVQEAKPVEMGALERAPSGVVPIPAGEVHLWEVLVEEGLALEVQLEQVAGDVEIVVLEEALHPLLNGPGFPPAIDQGPAPGHERFVVLEGTTTLQVWNQPEGGDSSYRLAVSQRPRHGEDSIAVIRRQGEVVLGPLERAARNGQNVSMEVAALRDYFVDALGLDDTLTWRAVTAYALIELRVNTGSRSYQYLEPIAAAPIVEAGSNPGGFWRGVVRVNALDILASLYWRAGRALDARRVGMLALEQSFEVWPNRREMVERLNIVEPYSLREARRYREVAHLPPQAYVELLTSLVWRLADLPDELKSVQREVVAILDEALLVHGRHESRYLAFARALQSRAFLAIGDIQAADSLLSQQLPAAGVDDMTSALVNLARGEVRHRQGALVESELLLRSAAQALMALQGVGGRLFEEALWALVEVLEDTGQLGEAAGALEAVIRSQDGTVEVEAEVVLRLAWLYENQGLYDEARGLYEAAMQRGSGWVAPRSGGEPAVFSVARRRDAAVDAAVGLSGFHLRRGHLSEAERWALEAGELAGFQLARSDDPLRSELNAVALEQLAVVRAAQDQVLAADSLVRRAMEIRDALGLENDEAARRLAHYRSRILLRRGDLIGAQDALERVQSLRGAYGFDSGRETFYLGQTRVEIALTQGLWAAAEEEAGRLIQELERSSGFPDLLAEIYMLRAESWIGMDDETAAVSDLLRAAELVEDLATRLSPDDKARAVFFESAVRPYDRLIEIYAARGDAAAALLVSEWAATQRLVSRAAPAYSVRGAFAQSLPAAGELDSLRVALSRQVVRLQALSSIAGPAGPSTAERLDNLRDSVSWGQENFRRLTREVAALGVEGSTPQRIGRPSVDQLLEAPHVQGSLVLRYHVGARKSFVTIMAPGGTLQVHRLRTSPLLATHVPVAQDDIGRDALRAAVESALTGLRDPSSFANDGEKYTGILRGLFESLIPAGVLELANSAEDVLVVPDDALHYLPFEALVAGGGTTLAEMRFLLDVVEAPVRYAPSLSALSGTPDGPASARTTVLSLSDALYERYDTLATRTGGRGSGPFDGRRGLETIGAERDKLERLRFSALETRAIKEALSGTDVEHSLTLRVRRREAATEQALRTHLSNARVLHMAAHGLVDDLWGDEFAAIVLTPPAAVDENVGPENDGFVQVHEVFGLPLEGLELAVLSACETNIGAPSGTGVFSLSRAFLAAGAATVVASQWLVHDEATAEMIGEFFAQLWRSGRVPSKAAALLDARKALRFSERWHHPYYWAGFVLIGSR